MKRKHITTMSIYAISIGDFLKFGISKHVGQRLSEVQSGCPYEAKLISSTGSLTWDQAVKLERLVHLALADFHERGEWFRKCQKTLAVAELMRTKSPSEFLLLMGEWANEYVLGFQETRKGSKLRGLASRI